MRIVVHQRHAVGLASELEPPRDATERTQRVHHRVERDTELEGKGRRAAAFAAL